MAENQTTLINYEHGLARLAVLMARENEQDQETFELRVLLDSLETQMSDAEIGFMQLISSDLYMLEDDEIYDPQNEGLQNPSALASTIWQAYQSQKWSLLLTLLRQPAEFLPAEIRAYLRGRAYEELGYHAVSWAFYQDAARRDTEEDRFSYEYFALYNLRQWDSESAYKEANEYLGDSTTHPVLKIFSVNVILQHFRQELERDSPDDLEERVPEIRGRAFQLLGALGAAQAIAAVPNEILASGYSAMALILEAYGDYENAADYLRLTDSFMPGESAIQRRIEHFGELVLTGKSKKSGIILNPDALMLEPTDHRENDFYSALDRKVERVFASV